MTRSPAHIQVAAREAANRCRLVRSQPLVGVWVGSVKVRTFSCCEAKAVSQPSLERRNRTA